MSVCKCVRGNVVLEGASSPVAGVRVVLFGGTERTGRFLAETVTGPEGNFGFDTSVLDLEGVSALRFQVYRGADRLITHGDTRVPTHRDALDLVVCVEDTGCGAPDETIPTGISDGVYGRVRHANGRPLGSRSVQLVKVGYASDANEGSPVTTDGQGWFTLAPPGSLPADLCVKVFNGVPTLIGTSRVAFNYTGGGLRLDVTVCADSERGASEYAIQTTALTSALTPTSVNDALVHVDLNARKMAWLAGKTNTPLARMVLRVQAHRLSDRLSGTTVLDVERLYGAFREGITPSAAGLLSVPPSAVAAAVDRAAASNVIGVASDATFLLALAQAKGELMAGDTPGSLGAILAVSFHATLPDPRVTEFCGLWANYAGTDAEFWADVAGLSSYSVPSDVDEARRLIRIGTLALGDAATVEAIVAELGAGAFETLGTWPAADWETVAAAVSPLPPGITGGAAELAQILQERAALIFPAATARVELTTGAASTAFETTDGVTIANILALNSNLDIRTAKVGIDAIAWDSGGDEEDQKELLREVQRLCRIAPNIGSGDAMVTMQTLGVKSARDVVRMGKRRFLQRYVAEDPAGAEAARTIVRKARAQSSAAGAFFLQVHPALTQAPLPFVANVPVTVTDSEIPGIESATGTSATATTGDYAGNSCGWCGSIHGPSAYLVDLLHWLSLRTDPTGTVSGSALTALSGRRSDIVGIPLTCENTERVLPYIDLAIEALEHAVVGGTAPINSSDVSTEEMLAAPQYTEDGAYVATGSYVASFHTPFHQPLAEARAFLGQLGVDRIAVMEAWDATDASVGAEALRLSTEGVGAITGSGTESGYWPFSLTTAPSCAALRRAAGLDIEGILDLLHTAAGNTSSLTLTAAASASFDAADYTLTTSAGAAPSETEISRLRRLIRLQRATGWSYFMLDAVLAALGVTDASTGVSAAIVTSLGYIERLRVLTGLEPDELGAWFADMSTRADRATARNPKQALFTRTWCSTSLFPTAEQAESAFPFGSGLGSALLSAHVGRICAVLQISAAELERLYDELGTAIVLSPDTITLPKLSLLWRWTSLARVLGVQPSEAVRLARLLGAAPSSASAGAFLETGSSDAVGVFALRFVLRAKQILAAGWTVDELDYLLRHEATERVAPADAALAGIVGRLRDAVARQDPAETEAVRAEALAAQLAAELGLDRAVMTLLDAGVYAAATSGAGAATAAADIAYTLTDQTVRTTAAVTGTLSADVSYDPGTGAVVLPLGTTVTLALGSSAQVAGTGTIALGDTIAFSDGELIRAVAALTTLSADVGGAISGTFGSGVLTTTATITFAASTITVAVPDGALSSSLCTRFLREGFAPGPTPTTSDPWADITRASTYAVDMAIVEALAKAALLVRRVGASADDVTAWAGRAAAWELLAPTHMVGDALTVRTADAYADFERLVLLFAQRDRLPGTSPTFAEVLTAPTAANLAARTGWDVADLEAAMSIDIDGADTLKTVVDRMEPALRAKVSPDQVEQWATTGSVAAFTRDISRLAVSAARSRYATPAAWASASRSIRDGLRKAQRDALVGYLLGVNADYEEADDVYQALLIDVSMNPEMLTSRIVQATNSVQLYIHRCLFGLEDESAYFNDEDRAEWEWMKNYRVWEAARKVFLYPENWIEPELRDDKSAFFVSLEQELAQGEITTERAEQGMLDYLDRLLGVASVKVLAFYHHTETDDDGATDVLHVVGRSYSDPPTYWYRRRENAATWTSWEKVEVGMRGDLAALAVYGRRLLLFWPEFTEAQSDDETEPTSWWEVRLSSSEYRDGRWAPKRAGLDPLSLRGAYRTNWVVAKGAERMYALVTDVTGTGLNVRLLAQPSGGADFMDVGFFYLNPCTMAMEPSTASTAPSPRLAINPAVWRAPGFEAGGWDVTWGSEYSDLEVYAAEVDEAGAALADPTCVELLGSADRSWVVLPSQWYDFVSQSPFFVLSGERAWFVEPRLNEADVADAALAEAPSPSGTSSYTKGANSTATGPGGSEPISDEEAEALTPLLAEDDRTSAEAAVELVKSADARVSDESLPGSAAGSAATYRFSAFYHPHVCRFVTEVRRNGIFGLLDPEPESTADDLRGQALVGEFDFEAELLPTEAVDPIYPVEDIDFSDGGAYSAYNWEIFFHAPYYVGSRLADAGQHEDAIRWFHAMFDPRTRSLASGVEGAVETAQWWKVRPFLFPASAPVTDWLAFTGVGDDTAKAEFEASVAAWRADPFNPHLLARLRPGTYQRALVMRYLDTLISWGDRLFSIDSIESLNEATQLYVFARQVLGDRPVFVGSVTAPTPKSFSDLQTDLDGFSNALVALENAGPEPEDVDGVESTGLAVMSGLGFAPYFCVPFNAQLLSYWDTLDDRLFKIRNGLNIEGVARSLALFQPPIDPAMLVRAAAAGIDIGSIAGGSATPGHYRFSVMLGRAQALAGSVRALGQGLLSALEKRDGEALARLRQTHEGALLTAVSDVRERQLEEAREAERAIRKSRKMTLKRRDYYKGLHDKGRNPEETEALALTNVALGLQATGGVVQLVATVLSLIPEFEIGAVPSVTTGGNSFANFASGLAGNFQTAAGIVQTIAGRLTTEASYKRRAQEWKFQEDLADLELAQIDQQLVGAELRIEIARRELHNHRLQLTHSAQVTEWMQSKFTNQELYDWMAGQLATLHFQSFQLALATARGAEACFQRELSSTDTFIGSGYWDGSRKGLLSGERLQADLERMDLAYLAGDVREHEMTKHVSLARLDPLALARLREEGQCYFAIPEALFDLDCPNHYQRRIQSVAVSIAAVTGAQGNRNSCLTLHSATIRDAAGASASDGRSSEMPSIVTSSGAQDSGLFQADLKDPRYLPFERRGAAGHWHLALTATQIAQFDWDTITDVTLHLRYTAKYADTPVSVDLTELTFGYAAEGGSVAITSGGPVFVLSARRDAPDELWAAQDSNATTLDLEVTSGMLGTLATREVRTVLVIPVLSGGSAPSGYTLNGMAMTAGSGAGVTYYSATPSPDTAATTYSIGLTSLNLDALDDLVLVLVMKTAD